MSHPLQGELLIFPWFVSFSSNFIKQSKLLSNQDSCCSEQEPEKKASNLVLSIQDDNNHCTPSTYHKEGKKSVHVVGGEKRHILTACQNATSEQEPIIIKAKTDVK